MTRTLIQCLLYVTGWGRSVTKNGELYYVNHVTKTTTWSRPQWTGSDGDDECESKLRLPV